MSAESLGSLHRAIDRLGRLPGLRHWRAARFDRKFEQPGPAHLFRGVYGSFEAARAAAPAARAVSYDNAEAARLYLDDLRAGPHDYPAFFWLQRSFAEGIRSVVDVGGSIGSKYFAYRRMAPLPDDVRWLVFDMPAVVREGRRFAAEQGASGLGFCDRFGDSDGCELLYASGSLQYLPQTLAELLGGLSRPPRRLVINTTAIHPERSYFTVNNIGPSYCAYRVQGRDRFVSEVLGCGYVLTDEWPNLGKRLDLPFEAGCSLDHYRGFCFDRSG